MIEHDQCTSQKCEPLGVWRQGSLVQGWRWVWQHAKMAATMLQDAGQAVLQLPSMREVRRWAPAQQTPACAWRTASRAC